jgi:radical SAM protein with 4Fe4S-binding SPASM domain
MDYRLKPGCALVEGAAKNGVYDFKSGKVYSIPKSGFAMLTDCRAEARDNFRAINSLDGKTSVSSLDNLTRLGPGNLFITAPGDPIQLSNADLPPKLDFLWLELTSTCNNRCLHCYTTSGSRVNADCVPHERWLTLISEAKKLGATAIQFIGGEPLLYPQWRELVIKAGEEGYDFIEVFTNATLVDDDCVRFFKQHEVTIATTIYADTAAIHDRVTQHEGSFEKTMTAVKKLLASKVSLRIASIIMKVNELEVNKIMNLCKKLGVESRYPDVVRPTGRGDANDLIPTEYKRSPLKPPFHTDAHSFKMATMYHNCLHGKMAVTFSGDVLPCVFARSQVCGNILSRHLQEVLIDQPLQSCWRTTKDQVVKCKDCEYRYACPDCRPLAQESDPFKCWFAPATGCLYNPHTGKWDEDE